MSRLEQFPVAEADRFGGICLREAGRLVEKLPEDTSPRRLNKIAAGLELLRFALTAGALDGSRRSAGQPDRS